MRRDTVKRDLVVYIISLILMLMVVMAFCAYGNAAIVTGDGNVVSQGSSELCTQNGCLKVNDVGCRWTTCNIRTETCFRLQYGKPEEVMNVVETVAKGFAVVYECGPGIPTRRKIK